MWSPSNKKKNVAISQNQIFKVFFLPFTGHKEILFLNVLYIDSYFTTLLLMYLSCSPFSSHGYPRVELLTGVAPLWLVTRSYR